MIYMVQDIVEREISIENEYALLLNALCRQRHYAGNYNDEKVYAYLEHVRKKSLQMSFIQMTENDDDITEYSCFGKP